MDLNYRNYNPLNIRATNIDWVGKTGNNKGFEVFSNPEYGYRAAAKNLYKYNERDNLKSVRDIVSKWAPPNENNTNNYVELVAKDLGVDPDADLGDLRSNPSLTKDLMKSMTKVEGSNNNFNDKHIENGIALANGKDASEIDFEPRPEDGSFNEGAEGEVVDVEETDEDIEVKERALDKKKTVNRKLQETKLANKVSGNWMSSVDSPTYKWTFYIVNSKVFNKPSLLEGTDSAAINNGEAIIISETGVTSEFAIDNVAMIQTVIPGQEHGNTTPGIIQFDLMEPLGFTFLDRILKAGKALGRPMNLPSQHYVLRLEFLGRDPDTGASIKYPNTFFYPIKINQVRSQTGPEGTRYNIIAFSLIKHAQTEAVTSTDLTVKDISTVQTFVEGLEKSFNQAEADKLSPTDQKNGLKPAKQIKILFADSTRIIGDKDAGVDSFNLKLKPWASTANADKGSGQSTAMDNVDAREAMVNAKTALAPYIQKQIQANCPAFATYVKEAKEKLGVVYSIHVEPTIEYGSAPEYAQTSESTVQVEAKLITFTIHVRADETTPSLDEKDHKEKFVDTKYQANRIKNLTLAKSYSYLYSGLNTEVLNYQIDVEQLYVTSKIPLEGIYHADGREQFTPTTPTKVTKFLDDISYDGVGVDYNDLVQYHDAPLGVEEQQKNETDGSDAMYAQRLQALAVRSMDAINFNIEIKGDPFWQGNTFKAHVQGKDASPNISNTSLLISLLNYNPNPDDLLEKQIRGPVDMVSTGIYSIRSVESRFQSGKFTQNLLGFKDTNTNPALVLNQIIQITASDNPSLTSTEGST
jgi:hypothetical protein